MKIYKRMVFLAPDDGGAGGAEPAPAPEAIDAPPVAQEPEYPKPKYYSQIAPAKADSEEYKALYKYQKLDELTDATLALLKENDALKKGAERSIVVPDGKDPEAVKEFARKLGIPDGPDGYSMKTLSKMQVSEDDMAMIRKRCHAAMLTDRQAEQFGVILMEMTKANLEKSAKYLQERKDNFRTNLSATYKEYESLVDRESAADKDIAAFNSFAEETGLKDLLAKTGVALNTDFVKAVANYARKHSGQVQVQSVPGGEGKKDESKGAPIYGSEFMKRYGGR